MGKEMKIINWEQGVLYITEYKGVSKIFWAGVTIYTAVVVAQSTGRW
jgi:hypothetical protein